MWQQLDLLINRETQENEREFYGLIGLVAVRFAKMEAVLAELLGTLIHPEDNLLTVTLTENLTISKIIELIRKISPMRGIYEDTINEIISEVNSIRKDRNSYIHGVWNIQGSDNGDVVAICSSQTKIIFHRNGNEKRWRMSQSSKKITLDALIDTARRLDELTKRSESLLECIRENSNLLF
jgi:hypothetical protein